jgi:23S rRNA (uracil1939-C5)-methyltransferase
MVHGLKMPGLEILPILESPLAFGYRHRLQLKITHQAGRIRLGFFRSRSHEVIPVQQCLLANQGVNQFLATFPKRLGKGTIPKRLAEVEVQILEDPLAGNVVFSGLGVPGLEMRREIDSLLGGLPGIRGVFFKDPNKKGLMGENPFSPSDHAPWYRLPAKETGLPQDLRLASFPSVFSQVNLKLNGLLIARLLKRGLCNPLERILDLFCGQGNLSLPFSFQSREVLGVEGVAFAVDNARWNQSLNGVMNCDFMAARVVEGVALLKKKGFQADMIILDPPRAGVRELIPALTGFMVTRIVYLSCDPMTLVRDLRLFLQHGWKITWSQPVDFFPQTYHLESITFLEN